ncbi:hypothetical protein [Clostridium tetani]|nr:hypothetical protein [Clostridium tetani]
MVKVNNQIYASIYKLYILTKEELKQELPKEQKILEKEKGSE